MGGNLCKAESSTKTKEASSNQPEEKRVDATATTTTTTKKKKKNWKQCEGETLSPADNPSTLSVLFFHVVFCEKMSAILLQILHSIETNCCGLVHWCLKDIIVAVHVCIVFNEKLHDVNVSIPRRKMKRRVTVTISTLQVAPVIEKELHGLQVTSFSTVMHWRVVALQDWPSMGIKTSLFDTYSYTHTQTHKNK
eukprot:m.216307 g.216307  ORF g.216307 m.216307 type:complete len:194 (-) comp13803_c1_seq27:114-695(-)